MTAEIEEALATAREKEATILLFPELRRHRDRRTADTRRLAQPRPRRFPDPDAGRLLPPAERRRQAVRQRGDPPGTRRPRAQSPPQARRLYRRPPVRRKDRSRQSPQRCWRPAAARSGAPDLPRLTQRRGPSPPRTDPRQPLPGAVPGAEDQHPRLDCRRSPGQQSGRHLRLQPALRPPAESEKARRHQLLPRPAPQRSLRASLRPRRRGTPALSPLSSSCPPGRRLNPESSKIGKDD